MTPGAAQLQATSTVVQTLRAIWNALPETTKLQDCRILSYREAFPELWGVGKHQDRGILQECRLGNLLLVWDGVPRDKPESPEQANIADSSGDLAAARPSRPEEAPLNVADCTTVYDWIVALCCSIAEQQARPALRVLVLDLAPEAHSTSFGCTTFPSFLPRLPWVRVYHPEAALATLWERVARGLDDDEEALGRVAAGLGANVLGADCLLDDLGVAGSPLAGLTLAEDDRIVETTGLLRNLWVNQFTKPGGRHAISNLVAPHVLADGLRRLDWAGAEELRAKLATDLLRSALRIFLNGLGLLHEEPDRNDSKSKGPSTTRPLDLPAPRSYLTKEGRFFPKGNDDVFDRYMRVRFLLVDDQYRLGYDDILACLLFGRPDAREAKHAQFADPREISLTASNSPSRLVEALYDAAGLSLPQGPPSSNPEEDHLERLLHFFDRSGACRGLCDPDPDLARAAKAARQRLEELRHARSSSPGEAGLSDAPRTAADEVCPHCGGPWDVHHPNYKLGIDWDSPRILDQLPKQPAGQDAAGFDIVLYDLRLFGSHGQADSEGTPEFIHHLLLPLLLSHFDPSLPIVVFSSSQQRAVAEALGHRPNIVTTFSKPVVSGYTERRSGGVWIADLCRAIGEALWLHEIRVVWRRLTSIAARGKWGRDPVFEITVQGSRREYNSPGGRFQQAPQQQWDRLIGRLAADYQRYLLSNQLFDCLTIPYELLEGALIPQALLRDPAVSVSGFKLSPELDDPDNHVVSVFRLIRHNKAHGHAKHFGKHRQAWKGDRQQQRLVVILFHLLLDFIARDASVDSRDWDALFVKVVWKIVTSHSQSVSGVEKIPQPGVLAFDEDIGWPLFALFVMVAACRLAKAGTAVSAVVASALEKEVQRFVADVQCGQVALAKTGAAIIVDDSGRKYALARRAPEDVCRQTLQVGDRVFFGVNKAKHADGVLRWDTVFR